MSSSPDISTLYREFTEGLTEVLAENAVAPYRFYFSIAARMGVLRTGRSHVYPKNFRLLPWSEALAGQGKAIEALRTKIESSARAVFSNRSRLLESLGEVGFPTLREALKSDTSARMTFEGGLRSGDQSIVLCPGTPHQTGDEWSVRLSQTMFDRVVLSSEDLAEGVYRGVARLEGEPISRTKLFSVIIPIGSDQRGQWDKIVSSFTSTDHQAALDAEIKRLDAIVGTALGLSKSDVEAIRVDLRNDPLLKLIQPRWPGTEPRIQGLRQGLESAERYE
jgi:hypothetical protein